MLLGRSGAVLRVGELFAGIGGFGLAAHRAGCEVAWACEIDPFATSVYRARFPTVPMHPDVQEFPHMTQRLPASDLTVDCITAGFPCQDVSIAGKRKGLTGERTRLFWHIPRIARQLRPRWLLLENVPGLLSSHRGRDFESVLAALDDLGYGLAWRVLDAQHFGVPQRRRRVFIVGHLGAPCPAEVLFEPESVCGDTTTGGHAGEGTADGLANSLDAGEWRGHNRNQIGTIIARPVIGHQRGHDPDTDTLIAHSLSAEGADASEDGTGRGTPMVWGISSDTIDRNGEGDGSAGQRAGLGIVANASPALRARANNSVVASQPRRLTPRECERLQGFPDDWTLVDGASDSARYRVLGNAVAVPCVEWILRRMVAL